jgi:hypothetical protein
MFATMSYGAQKFYESESHRTALVKPEAQPTPADALFSIVEVFHFVEGDEIICRLIGRRVAVERKASENAG